jgi:phosphate transport system substrate-binding protein
MKQTKINCQVFVKYGFIFSTCIFSITGCNNKTGDKPDENKTDTTKIYISVDESFKPVIDEQIKVYESSNSDIKIIAQYKPEAECLRDLKVDSINMVIATRISSEYEDAFLSDSLNVIAKNRVIARDAIAVIVHPLSDNSFFTMKELKEILTGKFKKNLVPVFDGVKATGTVRFIVDSVLRGDSLSPIVKGVRGSGQVVDYVANTPNAIGFVGISWVGNREDTMQSGFLKRVKLAMIESLDSTKEFILPVQANIYYQRYPMVRDLVCIVKVNANIENKGAKFANFMAEQRGQLIFRRAYLKPVQMPFMIRNVKLNEGNDKN